MFELMDVDSQSAVIKVVGVGGGGGNAVNHMLRSSIEGVEFICANTDAQALKNTEVKTALQLGSNVTRGLGAGANPDRGCEAAMEDRDRIHEAIEGADMVFITAGMGGGTGTGAAPVVAEVAKELGILTVAVVTKPFSFEGGKRRQIAEDGIARLSEHVDSLITIPNEKLLSVLGKTTSLRCLQISQRCVAECGPGDRGIDHQTGPDQCGLRRRAHCDVRNGRGHDGYRPFQR